MEENRVILMPKFIAWIGCDLEAQHRLKRVYVASKSLIVQT